MPTEKVVPIIAEADRIAQVINSYLANIPNYSPEIGKCGRSNFWRIL
ncbi:MAG: hypothetical protein ACJ788_00365 [Ktedonobacteraceae bacterium]